MESSTSKLQQTILWFLPTGIEIAIYIFITIVTFVLSSAHAVREALFFTGDFNPIRAGIASVDYLLTSVIGEKLSGSLSLAIFWGLVGVLVNVIWWLGSNFSTELNNDLVFSRYVHPKDADPKSQLREFIEKTLIRTTVAVIAIVYLNFLFSQGLPHLTTRFGGVIENWPETKNLVSAATGIVLEILLLHIVVILARMILLRKKVFDS